MTEEELNQLMGEMAQELRELGIPVAENLAPQVLVNSRAKRRLGCCYWREGQYTVEVSAALLEDPHRLRQTLAHELLHTCPGCRNHGPQWKAYAALVNRAWGYEIQRLAPDDKGEAGPLRQEEIKYVLRCQSCGAEICRSRMSKAVKAPWRYRCRCGGKLERIR